MHGVTLTMGGKVVDTKDIAVNAVAAKPADHSNFHGTADSCSHTVYAKADIALGTSRL